MPEFHTLFECEVIIESWFICVWGWKGDWFGLNHTVPAIAVEWLQCRNQEKELEYEGVD